MRRASALLLCAALTFSSAAMPGCRNAEEEARQQQQASREAQERAERQQMARYKTAIERSLHEDQLTGSTMSAEHTNAMRSIDLSECPSEFRVAYMNHIHAWDEAVAVQQAKQKLDAQEGDAAVAGLIAQVFDSSATPWSDQVSAERKMQNYRATAVSDIRSSFEEVETIASKYGAVVPHAN